MSKRIMIVDDSMRARLELKDVLLTHGFSVAGEASSGRAAVDMYEKVNPDLVMVDAQMPDMDGICTIREILEKNPDAILIVCAGSGEKSAIMEALRAGAIDFCAKPYVPRRIVTTIRHALAGITTH